MPFVELVYSLLVLSACVQSEPSPPSSPPPPTGPTPPSGPQPPDEPPPPNDPLITVGGVTLAADSAGAYQIGSQTLQRGSQVVVSQTTYALGREGMNLIVNGQRSKVTMGAGGYVPCFSLPINGDNDGCFVNESGDEQPGTGHAISDTSSGTQWSEEHTTFGGSRLDTSSSIKGITGVEMTAGFPPSSASATPMSISSAVFTTAASSAASSENNGLTGFRMLRHDLLAHVSLTVGMSLVIIAAILV